MIGKKINQLATELAPVSTDLTIIGDPTTGVSKKITLAQLGAIFSGAVSFYANLAGFPAVGDINVIYCAKDTQKLYLWSGSAYVEVFPSQALLDTYQLRSEKGNANGYASLDSGGKVPISQLPSSIMEYKGTWNASTNTPTLANGTGDTGDVYICNVAGTVNFGAGPITFAVGDYVIYSGTIWQRSSGAVGTVTSVAATITGDSVTISGSPVTTSGTLAFAFNGTTAQYIRGNGTLETFPTSLISGTGNVNAIPKFTANTVLGNSVMEDDGNFVSMRGLKLNLIAGTGNSINFQQASGIIAAGLGYSSIGAAGSTGIKFYLDQNSTTRSFVLDTTTITSDTERTYSMPNSSGTLALTSDIPSVTGYVPYTGATANLDLGSYDLTTDIINLNQLKAVGSGGLNIYSNSGTHIALMGGGGGAGTTFYGGIVGTTGAFTSSGSTDTFGITHSSGSGIALNITKGGSGEGLYINKTSGSGNAATIIGTLNATTLVKSGGTSSQFLKADGSVDSTSYGTGSVTSVGLSSATSGVTIGSTPITTSGTITLAIATASGSQQGLLSSTDWTTFNNKQNALTNPVTGTGTTNYLPKFTGTSTIGNSLLTDNGTNIGLGVANPTAGRLQINVSDTTTAAHLQIVDGTTTLANSFVTNFRNANDGNGRYSLSSWQVQNAVGNDQNGFIGVQSVSGAGAYTPNIVFGQRTGASTYATRMTLDASGNLGLGVTPSAMSAVSGIELVQGSQIASRILANVPQLYISSNIAGDSYAPTYKVNGYATQYRLQGYDGSHAWYIAPSGTAGNAISFTQAMTLNASGNLGLGVTSPSAKLQIKQSSSNWYDGIRVFDGSSNTWVGIGNTGSAAVLSSSYDNTGSFLPLAFYTSDSEKMRLNASGNLSIGNTNNTYKLDVTGTARFTNTVRVDGTSSSRISLESNYSGGNVGIALFNTSGTENIWLNAANGSLNCTGPVNGGAATFSSSVAVGGTIPATSGKLSVLTSTSTLGATADLGLLISNDGSAGKLAQIGFGYSESRSAAVIGGVISNGGGATTSDLFFATRSTTTGSDAPTERMRITSAGNVGIGTTSPSAPLTVAGNISLGNRASSGTSYIGKLREDNGGIANAYGIGFVNSDVNGAGYIEFYTTPVGGSGSTKMTLTGAGNLEIATGSIKTGEPDTGWGRAAIKIGAKVSGEAFNVDYYLPVSVDGTVYYINLNSSTP
jgi:hypothetical protein